jgi:outer membrane protein assembly factor BamD
MDPTAAATPATSQPAGATTTPDASGAAAPVANTAATPAAPAAPLAFQDIPAAGSGDGGSNAVMTNVPGSTSAAGAAAATGGTNSVGVEVLTPGANAQSAADPNGGLKAVGPTNTTVAPPVEKPAVAPDAVNDVVPGAQAPGQPTTAANGKKTPKPAYDKDEESSSKHKKKKGLAKVNPF